MSVATTNKLLNRFQDAARVINWATSKPDRLRAMHGVGSRTVRKIADLDPEADVLTPRERGTSEARLREAGEGAEGEGLGRFEGEGEGEGGGEPADPDERAADVEPSDTDTSGERRQPGADRFRLTDPEGNVELELERGDAVRVDFYNTIAKDADTVRGVVERIRSAPAAGDVLLELSGDVKLFGLSRGADVSIGGARRGTFRDIRKLFGNDDGNGNGNDEDDVDRGEIRGWHQMTDTSAEAKWARDLPTGGSEIVGIERTSFAEETWRAYRKTDLDSEIMAAGVSEGEALDVALDYMAEHPGEA